MSTVNQKNNKSIGFFDSGVGGLSVYAKFRQFLPNENTLYFGDLKNLPYGNKSKDELIGFARRILNFYKNKDVKAVVIACNTSSAQAYETIKKEYDFNIYPIIQSSAKLIAESINKHLGIFATSATVSSGVYSREIKKYNSKLEIKEIACPNWVSIVEGHFAGDKNAEIKSHLDEIMAFNPERIILGCTHYPYLLKELIKYVPEELFIDPAEIFVNYIKQDLIYNDLLNVQQNIGDEAFFVSASPESFVENSKIFYDVPALPEIV